MRESGRLQPVPLSFVRHRDLGDTGSKPAFHFSASLLVAEVDLIHFISLFEALISFEFWVLKQSFFIVGAIEVVAAQSKSMKVNGEKEKNEIEGFYESFFCRWRARRGSC